MSADRTAPRYDLSGTHRNGVDTDPLSLVGSLHLDAAADVACLPVAARVTIADTWRGHLPPPGLVVVEFSEAGRADRPTQGAPAPTTARR